MTLFSIFRQIVKNQEKIQEKIRFSFEYFSKYYGKWSICSKRANSPFSIIFSKYMIFQWRQKALLWSKGIIFKQVSL